MPASILRRLVPSVCCSIAVLTAAGCSGGTSAATGPTSPGPGTATASTARAAALSVLPHGGKVSCVAQVRRGTELGYWASSVHAVRAVTITDVSTEVDGTGVTVLPGEAARVVRRPFQPTGLGISDWPIADVGHILRARLDWPGRTRLQGLHIAAGQTWLPLLRLRIEPGGRVGAIQIDYVESDGTSATASMRLGTRFARGAC